MSLPLLLGSQNVPREAETLIQQKSLAKVYPDESLSFSIGNKLCQRLGRLLHRAEAMDRRGLVRLAWQKDCRWKILLVRRIGIVLRF